MARAITAGDVWKPYVKPSLDGRLIFRKKNTRFSEDAIARLEAGPWDRMSRLTPSVQCRGLPMRRFRSCMRRVLKGGSPRRVTAMPVLRESEYRYE